jgi:predicted transcriptional regulator
MRVRAGEIVIKIYSLSITLPAFKNPENRQSVIPYKVCIFQTNKTTSMSTVTVNISFQDSLLNEIDKTARKEHRSRSELLREAARLYIQRQQQWEELFRLGDQVTEQQQLTIRDVEEQIASVRQNSASRS